MRIITLNVNGIRSAAAKGLFPWLARQRADVICLQEVRATEEQVKALKLSLPGYHAAYYPALRPGYAGVAMYSRVQPVRLVRGIGIEEFDQEGRYLEAHFPNVAVVSLYLPSGSAGPHRQASKDRFLRAFLPHLQTLKRKHLPYILCGDWNIAHRPIDLKNWRSNQKNSGFLPHERSWLDELFDSHGYHDAFRKVDAAPERYTWWSNRGQAWAKNVGWRIDYQIASPTLGEAARRARIYKERRFSDHAPLIMDYEL
jgi:exodeoxyribonuclease-3